MQLFPVLVRAGAYEPPKAAKEHVTTVPLKYKSITYSLRTSVFDDVTVVYKIIKVLAMRHQSTTIASNGWIEIKYRHARK